MITIGMPTAVDVTAAVTAAIRAPSMLNSQPWRFRRHGAGVDLRLDPDRGLPVVDPTGWAARLACGAATYNLRLAFAVQGAPATVVLRPDAGDPYLMARLTPGPGRPPTVLEQRLFAAIGRRRSNRAPFAATAVPAESRAALVAAARDEGAWLNLLVGAGPLAAVAEIARAAGRVLERDPAYRAELAGWLRDRSAGDGIDAAAAGSRPQPHDLLPQRPFSDRPLAPGRHLEEEPLVAVLGTTGNSVGDQLTAGQALQRVLLVATDAGLAVSMLSQPIEVPAARERLRSALGRSGTPQMVLRLGYGQPGRPSPRRPVAEVLAEG